MSYPSASASRARQPRRKACLRPARCRATLPTSRQELHQRRAQRGLRVVGRTDPPTAINAPRRTRASDLGSSCAVAARYGDTFDKRSVIDCQQTQGVLVVQAITSSLAACVSSRDTLRRQTLAAPTQLDRRDLVPHHDPARQTRASCRSHESRQCRWCVVNLTGGGAASKRPPSSAQPRDQRFHAFRMTTDADQHQMMHRAA